jgi:O-succinylbenzoate synthase
MLERAFRPYSIPFRRPIQTARGWWRERTGFVLRERSSRNSLWRYGEIAPLPGWESVETINQIPHLLEKWTAGECLDSLPGLSGALRFALTCLDHDWLSQPITPTPLDKATLLDLSQDLAATDTFSPTPGKVFKAKIDAKPETFQRWKKLCKTLPPSVGLRWDANGSLTLQQMTEWLALAQDFPSFQYLEEPCPWKTFSSPGWENLGAQFPHQIAWDESLPIARPLEAPFVAVIKPSILGELNYQAWLPSSWKRVYSTAWEGPIGREAVARIHLSDKDALEPAGLDSPLTGTEATTEPYRVGQLSVVQMDAFFADCSSS